MPYWRFEPAAARDDPRWLDYPMWKEVVVRADTAAAARVVASEELAETGERLGNESTADRTGFEDEKLYLVTRLATEETSESDASRPRIIRAVPMQG